MAVPPNTNEAFLREVDEELRRDELIGVWRRYGRAIAAVVMVALLAFGGWLYYQHWSAEKRGSEGAQLLGAYDQLGTNDLGKASPALASLAQDGTPGYRAMARFAQGDVLLGKKDLKGAAAKFAEVASDGAVAPAFRDLALVRQTNAEFDTLKPQVVIDRLRSLAVKGNPWFGSAGEMVAVSYLELGKPDIAHTLYTQMASDEGVPETIRQRAIQMATTLGAGAPQGKKAS